MARFFIDRPVFAWVISFLIMLAGIIAITALPVSQYPAIAPPSVEITAVYPGASASVVEESVTAVIEREMNGVPGLIYMSATSASSAASLKLTFKQGTNPDIAAVDVQNRLKVVESKLPEAVRKQGVRVEKTMASFLQIVSISSPNGEHSATDLGEFASSNILPVLKRVEGVGTVMFFGAEKAMRIWPQPEKMTALKVTAADIVAAVQAYNARIIIGAIGSENVADDAPINAAILSDEELTTPEEFERIPLRMNADGSALRLGDVAKLELGGSDYSFISRLNGSSAVGMAVQLANGANALATSQRVEAAMESIKPFFPHGIEYQRPYDTSAFVRSSIIEVVSTLLEAIFLVFVVMYLFMQNIRATLIPTIVVPVALLGTFAVMYALGFSVNMLTMFGMVLAIGILVDDAIVVVENVERIMREEGLNPRAASIKAMDQISGAIIGITAVLVSVFIPMAFFSGAAGNIYRQFSLSLAVSIAFSAFLALSLTPSLCASFLKPLDHSQAQNKFFTWFNESFSRNSTRYSGKVAAIIQKPFRWMVLYGMLILVAALLFIRLPSSFLPAEDQGTYMCMVILPTGSTQSETLAVVKEYEDRVLATEPVTYAYSVVGFNFYGNSPNHAMFFVNLKSGRGKGQHVDDIVARLNAHFGSKMGQGIMVYSFNLPALMELGTATGFEFRMQDRGGLGYAKMAEYRQELMAAANKHPDLQGVRFAGQYDAPQLKLELDRDKARAMGISMPSINSALAVLFGSDYVGDFILGGQVRKVVVQSDGASRVSPEDLRKLQVRNDKGEMVELSSFARLVWSSGPPQLDRYNGFPAFKFEGSAALGRSSGDAIKAMETLVSAMPGVGYEWSGQTYEERLAGNQNITLYSLSLLVVFLVLSALYESWAIPLVVLMVVPLGVAGSVLGVSLRGMPNDIYFQVGLIAIIGLSCKNSILIVEMAKELWRGGLKLPAALAEACRMRLRPIIMTSLAFGFGVLPLVFSSTSNAQRAIGTGVLGGIITATVLSIFLVPVFFMVIGRLLMSKRAEKMAARKADKAELE